MLARRLALVALLAAPGCGGDSSPQPSQATLATLAPTSEIKAAMEFASAQAFEKSGKTKLAIDAYRRIIAEYPNSPQAKIAGDRMRALARK